MNRAKRVAVVGLPILVLVALGVYAVALRDLRGLENDYIASRQASACASRVLLTFGDEFDEAELSSRSERAIKQAAEELEVVSKQFERRRLITPLRSVMSARTSIALALTAQSKLFEAMTKDPGGAKDELETFLDRSEAVERDLARVRASLFVSESDAWSRRSQCQK